MTRSRTYVGTGALAAALAVLCQLPLGAKPAPRQPPPRAWPMFGGGPGRNMVNPVERGLPVKWGVTAGNVHNLKWVVELGSQARGGPVIAGGRVYVGTNNGNPRDLDVQGVKAVVMCFDEETGAFLWQLAHDIPNEDMFADTRSQGLLSTPTVDGDGLFYTTPSCVVVGADALRGKVRWTYDLRKELKVAPLFCGNCSPLVVGDLVFVVTGHGRDNDGELRNPAAPSFVALRRDTGKLVWKSNLPGDRIIEGQWSNPVYADAKGRPQVIFPGGDGVLYSFAPTTGKLLWKFDCHPQPPEKDKGTPNYFIATPVVVGDRLYIGMGPYPEHPQPMRWSHFYCVDVTKSGDVSPKSLLAGDPANKDSALVWAFGGPIEPRPNRGRRVWFGRTISTAAVHDGLVYIPEESGYLHCLDARTGRRYWEHDLKTGVWGSAYWADGRVYLCTEEGEVLVFAHGVVEHLLSRIDMEETMHMTPVAANGTLFVMTRSKLYALHQR